MSSKYLIGGLIGILALILWMNSNQKQPEMSSENQPPPTHLHETETTPPRQSGRIVTKTLSDGSTADFLAYQDASGKELEQKLTVQERNFATLTKALLDFSDAKKSKEDFITFLQSLGLAPIIAEDKQKSIEDLTIIRTRNSLPGVRYIHAQYEGDEKQTLQHFSFEIPNKGNTLEGAVDLVRKVLPLGERATNTDPRIAVFRLSHHVLYLKELTAEDMLGDPFNAYEPTDAGNIRVAIEREIHEHQSR